MDAKQVTYAEISPSEFFYRNRDLAGFSNPARALYAATRELFENSLDACELFGILPEVYVRIKPSEMNGVLSEPRAYDLKVQDNGPGVEPSHVPYAFGRVFYGSKFKLRQSRGMFGMGGTMAILYGQVTTGKPVRITTSTDGIDLHSFSLLIDIQANRPVIIHKEKNDARGIKGTCVEITLEGDYSRSSQKIQDYFKQAAMVTPYADIMFVAPTGSLHYHGRSIEAMPSPPAETLPHPHGIDSEALRRMLKESKEEVLLKFMYKRFHRVGQKTAQKFLEYVQLDPQRQPSSLTNDEIVLLSEALHRYSDFLQPDADCLSPLGPEILEAGIRKELEPEFITVVTRPPSAYSGYPFIVEVGLAYGSKILPGGIKLFRFANRIPLLYDEGSDVSWKVINEEIDWRRYNIPQDAPLAIITDVCSTRIPYKTVGKEYLADRPELEKELRNGIREALRRLSVYFSRKGSLEMVKRKMNLYSKYVPMIARFATELAEKKRHPRYRVLLGLDKTEETKEDQAKLEDFADS